MAIQNWINEDRRRYEEKRASRADDLQSEGGTVPRIKDQDMPPTIDEIPIDPEGVRLVDKVLEAPVTTNT